MIDIKKAELAFKEYLKDYNVNDEKVALKIRHTYGVVKASEYLAGAIGLDEDDTNLSRLIALLHDIGRFEQWKLYKTYNDKNSVDHGELSKDILDELDCNELFYIDSEKAYILKESIRYHTKEYDGNDKVLEKYIKIIKNADAYSNVFSTASGMQQIFVSEEGYNKELLDDFTKQKKLHKYSYKSKLDRSLMLAACLYYVEYDFLRKEIVSANYFESIYESFSKYLNAKEKIIYRTALYDLKKSYI